MVLEHLNTIDPDNLKLNIKMQMAGGGRHRWARAPTAPPAQSLEHWPQGTEQRIQEGTVHKLSPRGGRGYGSCQVLLQVCTPKNGN